MEKFEPKQVDSNFGIKFKSKRDTKMEKQKKNKVETCEKLYKR